MSTTNALRLKGQADDKIVAARVGLPPDFKPNEFENNYTSSFYTDKVLHYFVFSASLVFFSS